VSPRGALARFIRGRSPIKKRISSLIGQRYTLEHAALLHATSEAEADDVRSYGVTAPILVAPNGTTFAELLEAVRRVPGRVVFLGRLHPVKAIDRLLDAWHFIEASLPEAELLIAGPDEDGFGSKMQLYASRLGLQRVRFVGEVRGRAKRELLASAETLVLPSMNENFGMVVIEALAEGTPVVASRGTPWAALEEEALGRWVANTPADLADAMLSLLRLEQPDRLAMSAKAMSWVRDKFDSAKSARTLAEAYGRML
jgi:glycosyltransferase involved in cell wall biosynthesis